MNKKFGFTIVELLVLVVIVGILCATLGFSVNKMIKQADQASEKQRMADIEKIRAKAAKVRAERELEQAKKDFEKYSKEEILRELVEIKNTVNKISEEKKALQEKVPPEKTFKEHAIFFGLNVIIPFIICTLIQMMVERAFESKRAGFIFCSIIGLTGVYVLGNMIVFFASTSGCSLGMISDSKT